jgi:hypothetical protein
MAVGLGNELTNGQSFTNGSCIYEPTSTFPNCPPEVVRCSFLGAL